MATLISTAETHVQINLSALVSRSSDFKLRHLNAPFTSEGECDQLTETDLLESL